jgi:hypothetical protein
MHNTQCEPATRPISVQTCSTGISCTSEAPTTEFEETFSSVSPNEANLDENIDQDDNLAEEDENDAQQKPPKVADDDDETEEDDDESDMQGDDPRERTRKLPLAYQYRIPRAERLVDPNAPNEPT